MNADRLRERLFEEWSKAIAEHDACEANNEHLWDSECDVGEACAREVLRLLHRLATAGSLKLPNVPDWLTEARPDFRPTFDIEGLGAFDQHRALAEGWCLMFCDGRGVIEIQRDDEANTFSRPALGLPVFKNDVEACRYVAERAAEGSLFHRQALAIVESQLA